MLADPVALEQIIHNLLTNALQALQRVPAAERRLTLRLAARAAQASSTSSTAASASPRRSAGACSSPSTPPAPTASA